MDFWIDLRYIWFVGIDLQCHDTTNLRCIRPLFLNGVIKK